MVLRSHADVFGEGSRCATMYQDARCCTSPCRLLFAEEKFMFMFM